MIIDRSKRILASPYVLLIIPPLLWGGNIVVGRAVADSIPPFTLSLARWIVASLALLPWSGPHLIRQWPLLRRHVVFLLALAATGMVGFHGLMYLALNSTLAVNMALMTASAPVFILLLSWVMDRERATLAQCIGVLVTLLGVMLIVTQGAPERILSLSLHAGDGWGMAAIPLWALYTVLLRRTPTSLHPFALLGAAGMLAPLLAIPFVVWESGLLSALTGWGPTGRLPEPSLETAAAVLYVGIGASVIGYLCYNRGVALIGPNRAGPFNQLIPVFAALLAIGLLGERLQGFHLLGAGLILGGIGLANIRRKKTVEGGTT